MKGRILCPKCGRTFSFDAEVCPDRRTSRVPGRGYEVSLWHVTRSQFGIAFIRQAR